MSMRSSRTRRRGCSPPHRRLWLSRTRGRHPHPTRRTPYPPDPGVGPTGSGTGPTSPQPQPPGGGTGPLPDFRDSIFEPEEVEQLPQLLNPREAQRLLERVYPGRLRDAGVTGHTTVLLVIDRNGSVQPGSVTVQETTDDAFREAAVRAAERFRFRPATVRGQPVPVWISLPIEWTIQR
jgi:periplasmic protein TonB